MTTHFPALSHVNVIDLFSLQIYILNLCEIIYIFFFLNTQPDAIIIPISFCYKTLHISGIFCAHHQGFSTYIQH